MGQLCKRLSILLVLNLAKKCNVRSTGTVPPGCFKGAEKGEKGRQREEFIFDLLPGPFEAEFCEDPPPPAL